MEPEKEVAENETESSASEVLTQVELLNKLRKKYRNTDIIWKIITVLVIVVAFVFIYMAYIGKMMDDGPARLILSVVCVLSVPFCLYILPIILRMTAKYKAYNTEYKINFLQEKINKEFPKADYKAKDRISIKEISECSMIKKARSASANDCIEGTYKGVDFLRYDMELTYKKSKESSDCVLIVCNNKTELNTEIQIIQNDFKIGKAAYEKPEAYLEYVTGDENFDKKFNIYIQDESEAATFVDKELMKKISKFSGGGPIAAFFDRKKVYLIIKRKKDSMEAPIYKPVKESTCKRSAEKEAEVIKDWLQILNSCVVR